MIAAMLLDPIGRDQAREMARRELDKEIYHRERPSWLERFLDDLADWLRELSGSTPEPNSPGQGGGWGSVLVIVALLAAVIALAFWLMRRAGNTRSRQDALLEEGSATTAREHRDAAEEHAAAGRWPEAIRERLRAIARDLEERAILGPEPGRTADELAREAGAALPDLADALRDGVRIFDDVWYGDRPGSAESYARITELEDRVRAARPRPLGEEDGAMAGAGGDTW